MLKCCTQYVSKFGKLSSGHRTGKKSVFILRESERFPREGQCQRMYKLLYNCTYFTYQWGYAQNPSSQASMVREPRTSDVQARLRNGRGTRYQTASICQIIDKARKFQKKICFCFIDYTKAFDWVDHNELWKILQEMGIPDHHTCLLRNLYAGQEATVRIRHGTTD